MPLTFEEELFEAIGKIRAMAVMICRDRSMTDDLVQDTIVRMLSSRESYTLGTNMLGWAYRIMRNRYISIRRKERLITVPLDHPAAMAVGRGGSQEAGIAQSEVAAALQRLPIVQREALLLVGAMEMSYDEAAQVLDCSVGTVKSRVSRGRDALRRDLSGDPSVQTRHTDADRMRPGAFDGNRADGRSFKDKREPHRIGFGH